MKILDAQQIRDWDQFTIAREPIASIDLMERASAQCVEWLQNNHWLNRSFFIFCGKGNNGGDGLAIARMLHHRQVPVSVYILEFGHLGTADFQANLERLHQYPGIEIRFIQEEAHFPVCDNTVIIDALFGSGLNRPLDGITAQLVAHINSQQVPVIAIDMPSGLPVDHSAKNTAVIRADHTLSFEVQKLALLMPENAAFTGDVHILEIGLHPEFYEAVSTPYEIIDEAMIHAIYRPRDRFAHKGNFGHSLIVAGAYGKMGAAVLSTRACLRSGAGLTTSHIPGCGYEIMQTVAPEAMANVDFNSSFVTRLDEDLSRYDCIGIGPGIGTASETKKLLHEVFDTYRNPMVIDADALNLVATDQTLIKKIPANSILTPHPKEFERLFGKSGDDFERIKLAQEKAKDLGVVIILKGHHSMIATPGGKTYFNQTGNAGMAKGGSGDVLTGILAALCGQYPDTIEASILGVYLHGLAGDIAAAKFSMESMTASDLVDALGEAFAGIPKKRNDDFPGYIF